MDERRLGPVVGLGTWNTFEDDAALARRVVGAALDAGIRLFDTSPMYRGAEASLSAALDGRRAEATIATKIWAHSVAAGREQFLRQLEWYGRGPWGAYVDRLACILPFEEPYFRSHGVNATFVGHPLFDELPADRMKLR